jgi:predicted ATPase
MVADAYTKLERFEDARHVLDEALAVAEKNDDRCYEAELHRLRGELILAESPERISDAETCFHRGIETARRQQSKGWELRGTTSLARFWRRIGREDDARAALAAIYDTFTEGFTTADLEDANRLVSIVSEKS